MGRICRKGRCYAISVSSASQNLQYLYVKDDVLISDECSYLFCVLYCKHRVHSCHYYIGLLFLTVNCFNITILVLCCPGWFWLGLVFFSTESRDWLGRTSPKWPILCLVALPSVLWRCWLGGRKGIRPVKNWVVRCWHGYLSGARCRRAYGPADATATYCLLLQ